MLTQDQGSINWSNIVESFDLTSNPLLLLSPLGFPLFLALLLNPPQSPHPPIAGLLSHLWTHANPQLVLIDRLLSLPSDTFNFSGLPSTQPILSATDVPEAPPNLLGSTWNCLEIFQVCGRAAASEDSQVRDKSKEILEKGIRSSPELVYLGLIQVPVSIKLFTCSSQNPPDPALPSPFAEALARRARGPRLAAQRDVLPALPAQPGRLPSALAD